ncbi:MAG: NAD(P)-dependent oxidoreductase [Alphaproteobacteria bacterium]|nr:NAD(P)-dependent oxidoreductase [Alphaproteobacteria bacterium]
MHDYAHTKAYFAEHKPTHLIHLAWYAEHGKFWNAPENKTWLEATKNLMEVFATNGGQRFIGAGTCAEYAWNNDDLLKENMTPLEPASLYGQCKNEARAFVQEFCTNMELGWAWGRIFFPYGPGEPEGKLIPSLIKVLRGEREPFGINQAVKRDFIHVDDVGSAFKALLAARENGAFNISSGQGISLQTITEMIAETLHADPAQILQKTPDAIDPVGSIIGDMRKMKNLGWLPQTSLKDGLNAYCKVL